eukprot:TRINITY_DN69196_c0_g1_i2.p1 TRINITY_DN69196_c0_g1~~TRINITY_DN69196_c0_g1_i2.p1  ORF type:complete len:139 (-),score=18.07 TRINITY_DN69196_c0_g1_i2:109-525(-)
MIRRPPRSTQGVSSAASDVYKRQSLYNLESERPLYNPDTKNPSYLKLAEYCLEHKVAVDIFACTQTDIDLASLLPMSSYIGGEINFYSPFNVIEQGEKLHFDIFRNLTRFTVYDIQGKVRCSPGPHVLCVDTLSLIHI